MQLVQMQLLVVPCNISLARLAIAGSSGSRRKGSLVRIKKGMAGGVFGLEVQVAEVNATPLEEQYSEMCLHSVHVRKGKPATKMAAAEECLFSTFS